MIDYGLNGHTDYINGLYPLKEHTKPSSLVTRLSQLDILDGSYDFFKNLIPKNAVFRR